MINDNEFTTVIRSKRKLMNINFDEIIQYKDLLWLFVKRDFVSKYKQTILGPAWAVVQPLLSTLVFTIIFGNIAKLTTLDTPGDWILPGFVFFMSGNICWNFFSANIAQISNVFINNRGTMGKVYYPRLIAPISNAFSNMISFFIQFCLFFIICLYLVIKGNTSIHFGYHFILVPLSVIQLTVLSIGVGIHISSLTTKYRDLAMLVTFGLQLWQYVSPIAYGLELIPDKYMSMYMINPVTQIVVSFRYGMFGFGFFDAKYYIYSWVISLIFLFVGVILFNKIERTFIDTI